MKPTETLAKPASFRSQALLAVGLLATIPALATPTTKQQAGDTNNVGIAQRQKAHEGVVDLRNAWIKYYKSLAKAKAPLPKASLSPQVYLDPDVEMRQEASLAAPQRQSLARASVAGYAEPDVIRSHNGELHVTLNVDYADNFIGKDPVHLRSFNGKLVGPTLRLKPGDTLYMTLKNNLPGERWQPYMMNELNSFNTTNMHFHGLHVSPNGISDNVLIQVGPHETQEYVVQIPANHPPGTYWYHSHRHGSTAGDVASGMSGALIIEGGLDDVPEIKAAKERVMALNQIPYIYKNTLDNANPPPAKITFDLPAGVVEAEYAAYCFGPGNWDALGRYTTINGVQLPVIQMRPGEVERWRFVDSGQRETIHLQLIPVPTKDGKNAAPLQFHEIAVDALALGRMDDTLTVELWPGYRSDDLVKAPMEPGEYLLVNASSSAEESLNATPEPLTYVARVVVAGTPNPMNLPKNEQLDHLHLPYIEDKDITGNQEAKYGILLVGKDQDLAFTIDGKSFDMETARRLNLGGVDEWTLKSVNDVAGGFVTHPFHIHVNPFEVTSIMAPVLDEHGNQKRVNGKLVFQEQLLHGHVWRDTVKIPGNGYVKMRTHYTDFIGTFVQHCHILDHEDQGMMELIDIVDPNAPSEPGLSAAIPKVDSVVPSFTLPDENGKSHSVAPGMGKPVVLFFFKGQSCLHCALQVYAFTQHIKEFQQKGIQVIGVTSDTQTALKASLAGTPCPFPILADPKGQAFAKFGCVAAGGVQHGTFALDAKHRLVWGTVGASPYLQVTDTIRLLTKPTAVTTKHKKQAGYTRNDQRSSSRK